MQVHNFFRVILLLALGTLAISEAEDNFEAFDVQFPDENIYDNDDILRYLYFVDEPNYATRRKRSVEGTKNDYHATSQMIPKSKQPKEGTTKADSEKALNVKEGEKETMETAELVFRPFFGYRSRFGYRRPFGFRRPFPIYYG